MVEVTVGDRESGKRLHRFLRQLLPGVPLSGVHKMIRTGRVRVNSRIGKADFVLSAGDIVRLSMATEDFATVSKAVRLFPGVSRQLEVLHDDADMIVVCKPAGLLVHGAQAEQKDTLVNRVIAHLADIEGRSALTRFTTAPVNRLDRNTSGVVLFAKTGEVAAKLAAEFATRSVEKWYVGLACGRLDEVGDINLSLIRQGEGRTRAVLLSTAPPEAKPAHTRFRRIAAHAGTSLLQIQLESGRTHQIRAHLEAIGHPLWGDVKYGGRIWADEDVDPQVGQHQWLHAAVVRLSDGRAYTAPLPSDFSELLGRVGYSRAQCAAAMQF